MGFRPIDSKITPGKVQEGVVRLPIRSDRARMDPSSSLPGALIRRPPAAARRPPPAPPNPHTPQSHTPRNQGFQRFSDHM